MTFVFWQVAALLMACSTAIHFVIAAMFLTVGNLYIRYASATQRKIGIGLMVLTVIVGALRVFAQIKSFF